MSTSLNVVGVSGSLSNPSRTTALVNSVLAEFGALGHETQLHTVASFAAELGSQIARENLAPPVVEALQAIESADVLVVGTPVYRGSYTGLFKHLFDFVDQYALDSTPVILTATGGSRRHELVIEHQLRPLFGFFRAHSLPVGIYAVDTDFVDYELTDEGIASRISRVVSSTSSFVARERALVRVPQW